jgi:hypothetical protein
MLYNGILYPIHHITIINFVIRIYAKLKKQFALHISADALFFNIILTAFSYNIFFIISCQYFSLRDLLSECMSTLVYFVQAKDAL